MTATMAELVAGNDDTAADLLIPADVTSLAGSVQEILAPIDSVPNESAGFDFTTVLGLLGEAYSKKLCALRRSEEQALIELNDTYQEYLTLKSGGDVSFKTSRFGFDRPRDVCATNYSRQYSTDNSSSENKLHSEAVPISTEPFLSSTPYKQLSKTFPDVFEIKESRELWQKKITVPEPFNMTIRDEGKSYKKKSGTQIDTADAPTRFHSNPVPAHVHLPMYQLITEHSKHARQERMDNRKRKLLAQVKPFHLSFSNRPASSTITRSQSLTNLSTQSSKFTAAPFPQHLFKDTTKNEKELVENLRQVRIKARAEEMYKQSSSPFTERRTLKHWNSSGSLYSSLKMQDKSTAVSKDGKVNFTLYAAKEKSSKDSRHAKCIPNYNTTIVRPQPPVLLTEEKPIAYRLTKSAILRQAKRQKEEEMVKLKKEEATAERANRKAIQTQLQKEVAMKIKLHNPIPCSDETIRQKLASHRRSQQSRSDEHLRELQDMQDRLKKRPLLIEQQVQKASRDAATRRVQSGKVIINFTDDSSVRKDSSELNSLDRSRTSGSDDQESEPESDANTSQVTGSYQESLVDDDNK